jgi:hypothetical protein
MVHTSTFRKYEVSSEKKKVFVPPSESTCTTFRILKKRVFFFPECGIPYTILPLSFKKKALPLFLNLDQTMWDDVRTPNHNTGLGVHET